MALAAPALHIAVPFNGEAVTQSMVATASSASAVTIRNDANLIRKALGKLA